MSQGTHRALEASAAKSTEHPPGQQPKWDVNHKETLNQIRRERGGHPDMRAVTAAQPHQDAARRQHLPQQTVQDRGHEHHHHGLRHQRQDALQNQQLQEQQRQIAQLQQQQRLYGRDNRNAEVNRTVVNNRYETNNNLKYLYGGLAGGALVGGGALMYANRDNYRASNYYNGYDSSDPYRYMTSGYNTYNSYDQYGGNQYDLSRYPNGDRLTQYGYNGYDQGSNWGTNDYIYGGTTYGGTPFERFRSRPIYENTNVDVYPSYAYRETNPANAIPALFGNLLGGVIGAITNSNHHKRYYNNDC